MTGRSRPPEVLYTPESRLRHPIQLWQAMWRDLLDSRELAWRLMVRDLSTQYRQSFLGIFWAFVPPIFAAIGFSFASNAKVLNIGPTDIPYPAYVMFSMALWQTFVESLMGPVQAVVAAKPMLARINFPREAIILSQLGQVGFNFGVKLILIVGLFLLFRIPVQGSVIFAPIALLHLIALGTAIGLLLAPLGALYEDVSRGLALIISAWLILTPVVYPPPQAGWFAQVVQWNPAAPLLVTVRDLTVNGSMTQPLQFWIASLVAVGGLLVGWVIYRIAMPFVVERISA